MKTSTAMRLVTTIGIALVLAVSATGQDAKPAEAKSGDVVQPPERLIYLPYKNLKSVFEKADGSVLVPYADYLKLWETAFGRPSANASRPPVGGVITSANYIATVEKDVAQISAEFVVQVVDRAWTEIPIRFGEAAIGKLNSDSGKVLLRGTGNGTYTLLFPTAGEHKVTLELTARVRTAPEGKSLDLEIPSVGITNFELKVPEADQSFEMQPKLVALPVESSGAVSKIKASVGSTEKISVRWHPRVGTKPDMELLASVTNQTLISIDEGLTHTDTWLTYEVLRGRLDKVKIAVPKGHRILDITSEAKVKEWKATEEENRQVVDVVMLSRLDGKMTLEVHTERVTPTEAFDVAGQEGTTAFGVHAIGVVRESGTIAVKSSNELTLAVEDQQGLNRIDESDVDAKLKRPGAIYFKYYNPAFRLKLLSNPVQPRLIVDHSSQLIFREDQIRLKSSLSYSIDRAGVFALTFRIPDGLVIENVVCDRMKQFDVSSDKKTLTINLREKTQGAVSVTAFSTQSLDAANQTRDLKLPILEPLNVELENGRIQVYAPEAIEVITDAEKLVAVQPDPAPQAEQIANVRLVSSWIYNRRPIDIPVRTVRKPTRLSAIVGTIADVKQGQIKVVTRLNFFIEYAGIDTFRFAVPEAIADKIQIHSTAAASTPTIKQQSRASTSVDGWVTWTIVMQREVLGSQPFEVTYDLTPEKGGDANKEAATIELLRVIDPYEKTEGAKPARDVIVSRIIGELTVLKDRALSVSATAKGDDVEPIDVRELQHLPQDGFIAFRYFKQPVTLELKSTKFEIQGVVETVVSRALIEMVFDRSGAATNRCRYVLKSSERQRLRLDLPENVEVLGVMVDRKPAALEKADAPADPKWTAYYVNVARTKSSDEPFTLAVLFRHTLQPVPFLNAGGSILARFPMIGGGAKSGVAVQQLYTKIWVPREYALVGTPKNFSLQTRNRIGQMLFGTTSETDGEPNLETWIGQDAGGLFDFPTEGTAFEYMNLGGSRQIEVAWWHIPFYTWVISGALVVIGLVLRKTSCENKCTIVILGTVVAAAYALRDPDAVIYGLQVASYGIIAVVAIWVLHGIATCKPAKAATEQLVPSPTPPVPKTTSESSEPSQNS